MSASLRTLLTLLAVLGSPASATAESPAGPPAEGLPTCIALLMVDAVPATAEWSWWLGAGGGGRDLRTAISRGIFAARAGAGLSFGLATFGQPRSYGGAWELRWGPWVAGETQLDGTLGEGGLELSLGQVRHAQWGTWSLRVGGGRGHDDAGSASHLSLTLTGGIRSAPGRYSERGACDEPARPAPLGFAGGVRLFLTARALRPGDRGLAVIAGIELEPSFFLPPYSLQHWIGAGP